MWCYRESLFVGATDSHLQLAFMFGGEWVISHDGLVETLWTLKGKKYQVVTEDLVTVVESLFKEPHIVFEDGATVWRALHDFRLSLPVKVGSKNKSADFSGALIE